MILETGRRFIVAVLPADAEPEIGRIACAQNAVADRRHQLRIAIGGDRDENAHGGADHQSKTGTKTNSMVPSECQGWDRTSPYGSGVRKDDARRPMRMPADPNGPGVLQ